MTTPVRVPWRRRLRRSHAAPPGFPTSPIPRRVPTQSRLAWAVWLILGAVIAALVAHNPVERSVSIGTRAAALNFLRSQPMYAPGQHGWIYPVQSAMVYVPFAVLPVGPGEVLWHLFSIGLFAWAVYRLADFASRHRWRWGGDLFLLLTLLTIPAAIGSARNGQMNLPIAAMFLHAALDLHQRRWSRAAFWLTLALAAKPTSAVVFLLLGALYRPLWWRLPIGLLILAAIPFLHPNWSYITDQYRAGLAKVLEAGEPGAGTFSDLVTLLSRLGLHPSFRFMTALRAAAAAATLLFGFLALRRLQPRPAIMAVLGLGTAYLMVFNPRTEGNSYIIMAPALACFAGWALARGYRSPLAWALMCACILLGIAHLWAPRGKDLTVRPSVALLFYLGLGAAAAIPAAGRWLPRPADEAG
jgi:hypothetical protein